MTEDQIQKECEEFLLRANFQFGWKNLESAARYMVRHAVIELDKAKETLRDKFACAAMEGTISRVDGFETPVFVAGFAYEVAKAMLVERDK